MPRSDTPVPLRYELAGPDTAPVVVLIGSLGTSRAMWDPQIAALEERHRVLRYDLRGHGDSGTPDGPYTLEELSDDLVALLDSLDIDTVSICGLSLGGMIGMWTAASNPDRVDRLVVACSAARFDEPAVWSKRAAAVRSHGMTSVCEVVLERWFTAPFAAANPATVGRLSIQLLSTPVEGYAGSCEAIGGMDLEPLLSSIRAPTLVIAGSEDPATPPPHSMRIISEIPDARLAILHAAHLANVEQPEAFSALVLDHLEPDAARRRHGTAVRRAVLGDAHVDTAVRTTTPLTAPFQDFITRCAWGEIWSRPGLSIDTRRFVTIAILVALGREQELAMHLRAASDAGVASDKLAELIMHTALYCGLPAANHALAVLERAIDSS